MSREKLSDSPLKKVVWQAVIDGPLMSYTSSQQYHNDRKDPVEINYSGFFSLFEDVTNFVSCLI
ncbi:hypothetical protein [Parasutterella sp.]|uniref:hypothetical protein n=1 Tax=Parasutterella sp. TaxID=2049037 RepID=UPI003AB5AC70